MFLKDPGLVILDEPSSRLDPATEQRLAQALTRLLQGRTAIIVAHRLETIERVDAVLVLDDGRVAEFRTPGTPRPRTWITLRPPAPRRARSRCARTAQGVRMTTPVNPLQRFSQ